MTIAIACLVAIAVIAFILVVRPKDLPEPEFESPFQHLDERKAAIYDNLRDLQFEYRVGKLSDEDYQSTKKDLQRELAAVLAEIDLVKAKLAPAGGPARVPAPPRVGPPAAPPAVAQTGFICPNCGAKFDKTLKFCGECGKSMKAVQA